MGATTASTHFANQRCVLTRRDAGVDESLLLPLGLLRAYLDIDCIDLSLQVCELLSKGVVRQFGHGFGGRAAVGGRAAAGEEAGRGGGRD